MGLTREREVTFSLLKPFINLIENVSYCIIFYIVILNERRCKKVMKPNLWNFKVSDKERQ